MRLIEIFVIDRVMTLLKKLVLRLDESFFALLSSFRMNKMIIGFEFAPGTLLYYFSSGASANQSEADRTAQLAYQKT